MKNIPKTIYLNIGTSADDVDDFNDLSEVTWCVDETCNDDIEYTLSNKWHNLIKNPDDVPDTHKEVLIKIKDGCNIISEIAYYGYRNIFDSTQHWSRNHVYGNVIAWIDLPNFNIK